MGVYTSINLSTVAHFDRCLFPDNLEADLIQQGLSKTKAAEVRQCLIHRRSEAGRCSIIQLYQEYIDDLEITFAMERMLGAFAWNQKKSKVPT